MPARTVHSRDPIGAPDPADVHLAEVRATRVAFDREEHHLGICAVGAALPNPFGLPAAISIPVPVSRYVSREAELSTAILAARTTIGALLQPTAGDRPGAPAARRKPPSHR